MPISAALDAAREAGLDLVEVAPLSEPPVVGPARPAGRRLACPRPEAILFGP
jgi:hypothetical protein